MNCETKKEKRASQRGSVPLERGTLSPQWPATDNSQLLDHQETDDLVVLCPSPVVHDIQCHMALSFYWCANVTHKCAPITSTCSHWVYLQRRAEVE